MIEGNLTREAEQMTEAVLMDMDGTLFDTERLSLEGWRRAGQETGCPMTDEQILSFRGRSRTDNCALFQSWFGPDAPYRDARRIRTAYIQSFIAQNGVPLKPGLYEMLRTFRRLHLRTCLATGTARATAEGYWDRTEIRPYLDASVCGDEVVHAKPDPEIFLRAAAAVRTPPENCAVLEDSPNGVLAARRAGCTIVVIPDLTQPTPEMAESADFIVPSLRDAAELAERGFLS